MQNEQTLKRVNTLNSLYRNTFHIIYFILIILVFKYACNCIIIFEYCQLNISLFYSLLYIKYRLYFVWL